ncbi:hypothetical protein J7F01_12330, partial [Streptomyces sp. ISL-22]
MRTGSVTALPSPAGVRGAGDGLSCAPPGRSGAREGLAGAGLCADAGVTSTCAAPVATAVRSAVTAA